MASFLNQLQRDWLSKRITGSAVTPQTPLGQLKRTYYIQYLGHDRPGASINQLEIEWLQKYAVTKGASGTSRRSRELWTVILAQLGLHVSPFVNDNMITFYINAPA